MLQISCQLGSFRVPAPRLNGGEETDNMGIYNFYQEPDQTPEVRVSGRASENQNSLVLKGDDGYQTRNTARQG